MISDLVAALVCVCIRELESLSKWLRFLFIHLELLLPILLHFTQKYMYFSVLKFSLCTLRFLFSAIIGLPMSNSPNSNGLIFVLLPVLGLDLTCLH